MSRAQDKLLLARAQAVYCMVANIWPYPICGEAVRLMTRLFEEGQL